MRGDLAPVPSPEALARPWTDPVRSLEELRSWGEGQALELLRWYSLDKRVRRLASRFLRAAAVLLAVAGGVSPLIAHDGAGANLGYIFLASAAGCVAFDHFFGISVGWMRDVAALMNVRSRISRFHLDWAAWQARPNALNRIEDGLTLIDDFVMDCLRVTENETAQWIAEFNNSMAALRQQANPGVTSAQDLLIWSRKGDLSA